MQLVKPLVKPQLAGSPLCQLLYQCREQLAHSRRSLPTLRSAPGLKARAIEVTEGATSLAETTVASSADTAALAVTSSELAQGCCGVSNFSA